MIGRLGGRLLPVLVAVLIAGAGVVGLVFFFNGRDDATFDAGSGPGRLDPDAGSAVLQAGGKPSKPYAVQPPTSGDHVRRLPERDGGTLSDDELLTLLAAGDVVLFTAGPPAAPLRALQDDLSGAYDPALAGAGAQLVLARRPGGDGDLALAWRRTLQTGDPADPQLDDFAQAWLGKGSGG